MDDYVYSPEPPKAVTDYLRLKGLKPSFSWEDVSPQEHAFAFTAAKAMQVDVLTSLKSSLEKARADGIPYAQWKRDLEPKLQSLGWWGKADAVDPLSGETRTVQLGSPRRLKTIYWANTRTARAAGQWERIQRVKEALPFLLYQLGPSENHRPHHEDKAGLILQVDDGFWEVWLPPNGWGCKCHVRQISRREAERLGYVGAVAPDIPGETYTNGRTGEVTQVPQGIDPGWNTNPGAVREENMRRFLSDTLDASPPDLARIAVNDLVRDSEFRAHIRGERLSTYPIAMMPKDMSDILGVKTRTVLLSQDTARRHNEFVPPPGKYPPAERWTWIQENMALAEVWHDVQRGSLTYRFKRSSGEIYKFVVKATRDRSELYLTTFFHMGTRRDKKIRGVKVREAEQGGNPA